MIKISWEEYRDKEIEEKIDILRSTWDIEDNYLIGEIKRVNLDRNIFLLKPFNLKYKPIVYPYISNREVSETFGYINKNNNITGLDESSGVLLLFEFEINNRREKEKDQPIIIRPGSIKILGNYWDYVDEFKFDKNNSIYKNYVITDSLNDKLLFIKDLKVMFEKYKESIENEIADLDNEITANKNINSSLEEEKKQLENNIERLNRKLSKLEKLGFPLDFINKKEDDIIIESINVDVIDHIKHIRGYLNKVEGLFYKEDIIERFYNGIKTKQIILLSGPPGTGKTSLVTGFAKAINAECKVISVKPNWTDNEDLLGFFNPMENEYVSTPFLDVLVQAKFDSNNIYIICLDEMNLAHIEYYFSEFITKLELKDPHLELYSSIKYQMLFNSIKEEKIIKIEEELNNKFVEIDHHLALKWYKDNGFNEHEYKEDTRIWENINRYPAIFSIPENVRFVGTLNMDETTKEISPKVIDRSFVIEVTEQVEEKIAVDNYLHPIRLISSDIHLDLMDTELYSKIKNYINELNITYLNDIDAKVSHRGLNSIKEYTMANEYIDIKQVEKVLDSVIVSKVLPKVNFYKDSVNSDKFNAFKKFYEYIGKSKDKYPLTFEKLERMLNLSKATNVVTFWG